MVNQEDKFKKVISHAKEYGYVFQSSEIYDGLSAVYDYGQNGVELKNNIRLNVVSPTVVTEALHIYADFFKGFESVGADTVAKAFVKSIEGIHNGKIYKVGF